MRFSLFMYCTVGRRAELEAGMAGRNPELYQRMLDEIAEYVRFAEMPAISGSAILSTICRSKVSRSRTIRG